MTPVYGLPTASKPFFERVKQATKDTAYIVEPTEHGFDLKLDIANAKWWGFINRAGIKKSYVHHVKVHDDGHYSITDDMVTIGWAAGIPSTHLSVKRTYGRRIEFGFEKSYALNDAGEFTKVTDYTYSTEEGRAIIQTAARSLGLKEKWPWPVLVSAIIAFSTLVLLVIAGLGVALYYLLP